MQEVKEWKPHDVDRHLVNLMVVETVENFDVVSDYQILNLMTVNVLSHGVCKTTNLNMQSLIRRLLKINPLSSRLFVHE